MYKNNKIKIMTIQEFVTKSFLTEKQKNYAKRYMELIIKKQRKIWKKIQTILMNLKKGKLKNKE